MSEVTLATLAMEVSVPTADAAIDKLTKLRNAASDLEGQAGKTATASKEQASAHGYMGTAAAQAEKTMRGLVEVYGTAFNASGRYRHSVEAEVAMILQNAKATAALAKEQERAAKAAAKAEADAAAAIAATKKQQADLEQTLVSRNADLRAAAIIREVQEAERAAAARAKAAQEAAAIEQTLAERNAAFRASMAIKEAQDAERAAQARIKSAQEASAIEQTLASRNADFRATALIKEAQAEAAAAKEAAGLAAKYETLRSSVDPMVAVQSRLAQQTRLLDEAMAKGVITAEQHADTLSKVTRAALADVQAIDQLQKGHVSAIGTTNTLRYTTLNLGRQFADIGTQLAGGQSPFLILVQQGPQIADAFATATAGGLTFKAVIAGLVTEAKALLLTFGPWIAAFAAVGGAIFVATKALSDHEKKVKDLYKAIDEQNKKLSESAPWLIKNSDNAYLAAEGQKNFEKYLAKTNGTLETQIKLLRAAAIEGLKKDLTEAQSSQKRAQTEFERISSANGRGSSPTGFTTNVGGFSTISAAPSRADIERTDGYKKALTEANKATDNVRIAQEKLNAALKVTPADYGAAFAGQASEAEKLSGALDTLLPKEKQIRDIRQQRAIVEQALAKGQISAAQAARAIAESEKQIAEINRDPAAERALKAEQRKERAEAKKELAELVKAYEEPLRASEAFADALAKEVAVMGLSNEQQKRREIAMQAAAAPTAALAAQIAELGAQWEAQTKVAKEWTDIQEGVKAAANDNIRTFDEQTRSTIRFSSTLEKMAYDLEDAAAMSRGLSYDIQDIAYAINNNDWTSAFAGMARVLMQVKAAFDQGATSAQKYAAAAAVAGAAGQIVGGTAGATISGAAAGAQLGSMIAPGIGTAIGAVLGGLGGLFGSSSAKKKARQQAAAQAAAAEAQRQQTIADTQFGLDVAILRAQGKEQEALTKERDKEIARLQALSPALVDSQKQLWALEDAATAAAAAAEKAAAVEARRSSIQDEIDKLTLSDSELLAKTRAKERAEAVALDPTLGDLIDKLYAAQDATAAQAAATKALEVANDNATRAIEQQVAAQQAMNDAATQAIANLTGLSKSLREFAGQVGDQAGIGGGYNAARSAFLSASASGNITDLQAYGEAFLKASEARFGNSREYMRDAALVRSAALAGANLADMRFNAIGQVFGNLPGFASGGSMVIGGNPGIDQNVLSINGQPQAFVGAGELLTVTPRGASNDNSSAALRSEVQALRQEVASLRAETRRGADAAEETFDLLRGGVITVRQG